ncbi:MAG: hypothetical protein ACRDPM_14520 [Solirubrobacteraceae bacterium]
MGSTHKTTARHRFIEERAGSPQPLAQPRLLSEFEHLLEHPGCPACTSMADAEGSYFRWFANESYSSPEVLAQLRAGMGMCPAHSRRLVEETGSGAVATIVLREALAGARQRLGADSGETGPCPVCATLILRSDSVAPMVVRALGRDTDLERYAAHDGLCLEHMRALAPVTPPSIAKLVAEQLLARVRDNREDRVVTLLAGEDDDLTRRAGCRRRLPCQDTGGSTMDGLRALLAIDACPLCFAAGQRERRYLAWLLEQARAGDHSLHIEPGVPCAAHLHDLAGEDPAAARVLIDRKRATTITGLQQLLDHLAAVPPPTGRRRRRRDEEPPQPVDTLTPNHQCPACRARGVAEARQRDLLAAALELGSIRRLYEASHGLCVRHCRQRQPEAVARVAHRVVNARVAVLDWEVQEVSRKYAWACRDEPKGPEQNAWLRALGQIDGRVLLGGPAPSDPVATRPR